MPDPAKPWSGDPPPRHLMSCYDRLRQPLRRPLEPGQYVSIKYTERLAKAGVEPSVGSVGDSYDNALAETINGLYKAEVIHRAAPGAASKRSSSPPSNGSTGSTNVAFSSRSGTFLPPRPRPPTMPSLRSPVAPRRTQTKRPPGNPGRFKANVADHIHTRDCRHDTPPTK